MDDFAQYLKTKWGPKIHSQKVWQMINVQGIYPVNYEDIIVDPILQEIMTKTKPVSVKAKPEPVKPVDEMDEFFGPF